MNWFKPKPSPIPTTEKILAEEIKQTALLTQIRDLLKTQPAKPGPAVKLEGKQTLEGKEIIGMITLKDNQQYTFGVKDELDAKGNVVARDPAAPAFVFTTSDDSLGTYKDDGSGTNGLFVASGKLGTGTNTITDPVNNLSVISNYTVIAGTPVTLEGVEGAPVDQPPAA